MWISAAQVRRSLLLILAGATFSPYGASSAQPVSQPATSFSIVWVSIGEASSSASAEGDSVRAGRQLFKGAELAKMAMKDMDVERLEVRPEISSLTLGSSLCVSQLRILAFDSQDFIGAAPLSIAVRQDHRDRLALRRKSDDICFTPSEVGEYPIRFSSLLPAADGTQRGAQVFLRVSGP